MLWKKSYDKYYKPCFVSLQAFIIYSMKIHVLALWQFSRYMAWNATSHFSWKRHLKQARQINYIIVANKYVELFVLRWCFLFHKGIENIQIITNQNIRVPLLMVLDETELDPGKAWSPKQSWNSFFFLNKFLRMQPFSLQTCHTFVLPQLFPSC